MKIPLYLAHVLACIVKTTHQLTSPTQTRSKMLKTLIEFFDNTAQKAITTKSYFVVPNSDVHIIHELDIGARITS